MLFDHYIFRLFLQHVENLHLNEVCIVNKCTFSLRRVHTVHTVYV